MLEEKQIPWRGLLESLARRRLTVYVVSGLGVILAVLSAFAQPPSYRATATLELTAERGSLEVNPGSDSAVTRGKISQQDLSQQVALLQRPALIREVLKSWQSSERAVTDSDSGTSFLDVLNFVMSPRRLASSVYGWIHQTPVSDPLEEQVQMVLSRIEIAPLDRSNLLVFSYSHDDPEGAARFVNDLMAAHTERTFLDEGSTRAFEFFQEQQRVLERRVLEAEEELDQFRLSEGVGDLPSSTEGLESGLELLREQSATATTDLREVRAKIAFLSREIAKQPVRIKSSVTESESPSVQKLRTHLLEMELQRSDLLSRYAPGSTVIRDIDRKVEELQARVMSEERVTAETLTVVNTTRQSLELQLLDSQALQASLAARVSALDEQIGGRSSSVRRLHNVAPELARLENEVHSATAAYKNYLRKEEEARFSQALDESRIFNLKVIEPAMPPTQPVANHFFIRVIITSGFVLLFGLLLALLRDWLDPTLKGVSQAERVAGLPVIAEIPSSY